MEGTLTTIGYQGTTQTSRPITHESVSRKDAIEVIRHAVGFGFKSNSVYNIDGSIDIRLTDGENVIGGTFAPAE